MFVSLLFWLALLLPGYAAARLADRDDTECGLLGMVALAYFWAFALLSPVSILCYVTRMPVAAFSVACVLLVVAGVIVIHRRGWWRPLGRLFVASLGVELLLVVTDLVFGARTGAFLSGDAEMHVARVRFLLDHGFSNQGPFVNVETFFAIYHTNLVHALYAACSQLTGTDYLDVWYISVVWAKLVGAGGTYYLAWVVLRSRWAAWLPALFVLAINAPIPYLMYPNKLAPLWLMPLALAVAIEALRSPSQLGIPIKLGAISLVVGQVHSLYTFFIGLVTAPLLAVALLPRLVRRRPGRGVLLACLAALFVGAPFPLIARYVGDRPPPDPDAKTYVTPDIKEQRQSFHTWEDGSYSLKFEDLLEGQTTLRLSLFAAALIGMVLLGRRLEAAALAGMAGVVMLVMFVPQLCTLLVEVLDGRWVALRLLSILNTAVVVAVGGAIGLALEKGAQRWSAQPSSTKATGAAAYFAGAWWARVPVSLAVAGLGVALMWSRGEHSWEVYREDVAKPEKERRAWINYLRMQRDFYRENIEPGSVVLTHPRDGRALVMLHDCYIVVPDRSGGVGPTTEERWDDLMTMVHPATPWPRRRPLLEKYGIDRVLKTELLERHLDWTEDHTRGEIRSRSRLYSLIVLDME
jgi:hypothetical protein